MTPNNLGVALKVSRKIVIFAYKKVKITYQKKFKVVSTNVFVLLFPVKT